MKNKPSLDLKSYTGKYNNAVYGDITIKEEKGKLAIYFSHHPKLIGHLEPIEQNSFLCTYSDPEYGVREIPFQVKDGKVASVTVTVNSFIDLMPYQFLKAD